MEVRRTGSPQDLVERLLSATVEELFERICKRFGRGEKFGQCEFEIDVDVRVARDLPAGFLGEC